MKKFFRFYDQSLTIIPQVGGLLLSSKELNFEIPIVPQVGGQLTYPDILKYCCLIPWKHNLSIIEKVKKAEAVYFYILKTIENNWSRAVLEYQIDTDLYNRQGKAINNFNLTLPKPNSDLANALLKDPYNFDFLTLAENAKEKELEDKLVQNITRLLLELGKGFAYMGRQFELIVGKKEYRTDLLFYHTKLKCYIVIELKLKDFEPEFIGKLNFYLTAINELVKEPDDKPTIGILLCKNKDNYDVEFALKDVNKPIGVSEFKYMELPDEIKNALPTSEEFKDELKRISAE
jgi:predicted nuclease of restriction endonuclease-like (RecB) superfamily